MGIHLARGVALTQTQMQLRCNKLPEAESHVVASLKILTVVPRGMDAQRWPKKGCGSPWSNYGFGNGGQCNIMEMKERAVGVEKLDELDSVRIENHPHTRQRLFYMTIRGRRNEIWGWRRRCEGRRAPRKFCAQSSTFRLRLRNRLGCIATMRWRTLLPAESRPKCSRLIGLRDLPKWPIDGHQARSIVSDVQAPHMRFPPH